jgi:D-alanyl-D-alanine carboxypeptidase (penicillin-binding protein 5/6)
VKQSQFRNYPEVLHFLEEMNKNAEILGLKGSFYDSPHGLSNYNNKSTALDIARLSTAAMGIPKFREVVATKFYTVKKNTNGNKRTYKWYNTHLMLGQRGINGIKTGITPAAGPCLCTSISLDGIELIVVIICTKSMDIRWPETWKLANWAMQRLRTIEKF